MHRRKFVKASIASLLASGFLPAAFGDRQSPGTTVVFFDERLPEAAPLAETLARGSRPVPVRGDATALLTYFPDRREDSFAGVTGESFAFCAEILLREHGRTRFASRRVGRDLIAWTLHLEAPQREEGVS